MRFWIMSFEFAEIMQCAFHNTSNLLMTKAVQYNCTFRLLDFLWVLINDSLNKFWNGQWQKKKSVTWSKFSFSPIQKSVIVNCFHVYLTLSWMYYEHAQQMIPGLNGCSLMTILPLTPCSTNFSMTSTQIKAVSCFGLCTQVAPIYLCFYTGTLSFTEFSTGLSLAARARYFFSADSVY